MAELCYNLVIVQGSKNDLDEFERKAFKSECQAFCMQELLPIPEYLTSGGGMSEEGRAFRCIVHGSPWVGPFAILVEKTDTLLKFYFNSQETKAEMGFLSCKYPHLGFLHVYSDLDFSDGLTEYRKGSMIRQSIIYRENMDWQIKAPPDTYTYLEELQLKIDYLSLRKPNLLDQLKESGDEIRHSFYALFPKPEFLKEHQAFYKNSFNRELDLETRYLHNAKSGTVYPFRSLTQPEKVAWITDNILPFSDSPIYQRIVNSNG